MQFILTCPNGKQIDMSSDVLRQMKGEITREEVQERINFYNSTNLWKLLNSPKTIVSLYTMYLECMLSKHRA